VRHTLKLALFAIVGLLVCVEGCDKRRDERSQRDANGYNEERPPQRIEGARLAPATQSASALSQPTSAVVQGHPDVMQLLSERRALSTEELDALSTALKHPQSEVRLQAVLILARLGMSASKILSRLSLALKDQSAQVRSYAAAGLRHMGPCAGSACERLKEACSDPEGQVAVEAAIALTAIDPGGAYDNVGRETLKRLLGHRQFEVRRTAVSALGDLRERSAVARLIAVLRKDSAEIVRAETPLALVKIGDSSEPVMAALRAALKDPALQVRVSAQLALACLEE